MKPSLSALLPFSYVVRFCGLKVIRNDDISRGFPQAHCHTEEMAHEEDLLLAEVIAIQRWRGYQTLSVALSSANAIIVQGSQMGGW